jgi:hypothetical protein
VLQTKVNFFTAIFLLGTLALFIGIHSNKSYELVHTNAQFIDREHATNFFVATRVKVRFFARKSPHATITYIYPQDQVNFKEDALVPITYELERPSHAYFAGPGGDVNAPNTPGFGELTVFFALIINGAWLIRQSRWRTRMLGLIDAASHQGPFIRTYWHNNRYSSTIITTHSTVPWQLSWKVLVIDSRIDISSLRQFRKAWRKRNEVMLPGAQAGANLKIAQPVVLRSGDFIFLPLSRAAPITLTRSISAFVNEGDNLMSCHQQLLGAYTDVLNRIRQLPALFAGRGRRYSIRRGSHFRTLLCWRFMIRLHTEAHIRRQLRNLTNAYVRRQFSSTAILSINKEELQSAQEECNKIVESLSDNSRLAPAIVVGLTIIAPLIPLILKANPVPFYQLLTTVYFFVLAIIIFLPGTIAVIVYADAFRFKRQLFGADLPRMESRSSMNIYELENRLYAILDQPKRTESASDLWLRAGIIIILWIALGRLYSRPPYFQVPILYWTISAIIIFPTWSLLKGIWYRRKAEK